MVDNTELINSFVRNFIQKDKRERCFNQLTGSKYHKKFTIKLNHNWDDFFNMKLLNELERNQHSYSNVQQFLKLKDTELCYIISDEEIDNTFLPFIEAFEKTNSAYFGTLLINLTANKLFLKTEETQNTLRFIGIAKPILP